MSDLRCPKGCKPKTVRTARAGLYRCNCCGFSAVRRSFEAEPEEPGLRWGEATHRPQATRDAAFLQEERE